MNMDLDNEELLATRKLLGLDKTKIEKSIENLKEYLEEDSLYVLHKKGENKELSDFDKFCIGHCEDIEVLITEYERQKQRNEEHRKINGELREKIKELEIDLTTVYMKGFEDGKDKYKQKIKNKKEEFSDKARRIAGTYQYADSEDDLIEKKNKVIELRTKAEAFEELLQESEE